MLDDIRVNQNEMAKPILDSKINQLLTLKSKLDSAEEIFKISSSKKPNFESSASTLLMATALSKGSEVKDLRAQISDLEIALTEPQTKGAFLVTPIYAPNIKVEAKVSLIVLGGIFGGFIFMFGYLLFRKNLVRVEGSAIDKDPSSDQSAGIIVVRKCPDYLE